MKRAFESFTQTMREEIFPDTKITPVYIRCESGAVGIVNIDGYSHPIRIVGELQGTTTLYVPQGEYEGNIFDIIQAFVQA